MEDLRAGTDENTLKIVEDPSDSVRCRIDHALFERCIANIVGNAAKYDRGGTLHVKVTAQGDLATISLADDGPGVPDDALPRLFDVFFRSDPARQHTSDGSGLGLAIVARAMKRMGGTAEAAPSPEGSLTVLLSFPLAKETE